MIGNPSRLPAAMFWLLVSINFCPAGPSLAEGLTVSRLRCEYRVDPLGIDESQPRLTWQVGSPARAQRQSAYQLIVASSAEVLADDRGDIWDSGKVTSDATVNVAYEGPDLQSQRQYFWKVRAWDQDGQPGPWSELAHWSMGILKSEEWSAQYISYRDESPIFTDRERHFLPAARQYRKEFSLDKPVRRATIYATALGIYELYFNGQRVGDAYFMPGWTDYHQRAYYQTYDVTDLLKQGRNATGAWVAEGWYSGYVGFGLLTGIGTERIGRYTYGKTPSVMLQLEIEFADGTRTRIATDPTWKVTGEGPIQQADFLMGEYYDATRENPAWAEPGYDDQGWSTAILAQENGSPKADFYEFANPSEPGKPVKIKPQPVELGFKRPRLEAFPGVPVRVTQEIRSKEVTRRQDGTYIVDLGQNFAGVVRLKVRGPRGHRVRLRYGEMLHPDGRLMTENLRKARATDFYVCRGDAAGETYTPRFTFHGFRYVELSDFPGDADDETITGLVLHSDTPLVSSFECSDSTINQLFKNIVWTQRANFIDLPTDCPQRDERMGWTGDAQVYVASAALNADVSAFYTKWLRELMESQRPSGAFPGYAPFPFQHGWDFGTAWADAGIICPWTIWQAYDDTRVIERCWEPMTHFMQWRRQTSKGDLGVAHGNVWGDWLAQGEATPLDYIDTIYYVVSARKMAQMAKAIGREDEAAEYRELVRRIKNAFHKKYVNNDGTLNVNTQTAYALALDADLIPIHMREATGGKLAAMIDANGGRMSTGFLGSRPLLPSLSSTGQNDLATFLLQSHVFPSWGYEVEQGATTIWERWDSYTKEESFGRHNAAMNSFSHYAFGAVCQWMFETLAGIRAGEPGYQHIVLRPTPPSPGSNADHQPIDWVRASYDSIRGPITSNWRVNAEQFELDIEIPANTTATVFVPAAAEQNVTVDGKPIARHQHVALADVSEPGRVVIEVKSGSYRIISAAAVQPATRQYHATSEELATSK
jgi:alpha-L-rhamnosidase